MTRAHVHSSTLFSSRHAVGSLAPQARSYALRKDRGSEPNCDGGVAAGPFNSHQSPPLLCVRLLANASGRDSLLPPPNVFPRWLLHTHFRQSQVIKMSRRIRGPVTRRPKMLHDSAIRSVPGQDEQQAMHINIPACRYHPERFVGSNFSTPGLVLI